MSENLYYGNKSEGLRLHNVCKDIQKYLGGTTLEDIAKSVGLSLSMLNFLLSGHRKIQKRHLIAFQSVFSVNPQYITEGVGYEKFIKQSAHFVANIFESEEIESQKEYIDLLEKRLEDSENKLENLTNRIQNLANMKPELKELIYQ